MIERINENEERLDSILLSIKELEGALIKFKSNKKNIGLINKYYGSKEWFKDKALYENNILPKVKAGVLGEDTVWNMNDDLDNLILEMKSIVLEYLEKWLS